MEFLKEIPPPLPRSYFRIQESDSFESLVRQFPRTIESILEGIFIGPHYFDLQEIRHGITGQPPHSCIPVFILNFVYPYLL